MTISKPTKIFLINFTIIIISITALAIYYTNKHSTPNESTVIVESTMGFSLNDSTTKVEQKDMAEGIDVNGTYRNNGVIFDYEKSSTTNGYDIVYPKINGLKDSSVEDEINTQIMDKINKIAESSLFTKNANQNAIIKGEVVSSFANTVSIKLTAKMNENYSKTYGINFNLRNGVRVKLGDLFTGNAPDKNIVSSSAYKCFSIKYITEDGISNEFYNNIDSEILNFMMAYDNGKVAEFTYTPLAIELYKDGQVVKIDMTENPEYYAIYTRFRTDNDLYTYNDRVASDVPTLVKRPDAIYDLYKKENDFCYYDVVIRKNPEQEDGFTTAEMTAIKNYKKEFKNRIEVVKDYSGIYYSNYVTVTRKTEDGKRILVFDEDERYVIVEKAKFKEEVYNKILAAERNVLNEDSKESKINVLDSSMIQKFTNQKKYRVDSGKEIVEETVEPQEEEDEQEGGQPEENTERPEGEHTEGVENNPQSQEGNNGSENQQGQNTPQESTQPSQAPSPSQEITTQVYY